MADWEVLTKYSNMGQDLQSLFNPGMEKNYMYVIKNVETGEIKTVQATDQYELGEKISDGDFEDEDEE